LERAAAMDVRESGKSPPFMRKNGFASHFEMRQFAKFHKPFIAECDDCPANK
jgi:hypothetical protein